MTNFQLYEQISALPFDLKQEVINFIEYITKNPNSTKVHGYQLPNYLSDSFLEEPSVVYQKPLLDLLLSGPTFTDKQVQRIINSRNF